jgi:fibronectin type 3 domain-containing protein
MILRRSSQDKIGLAANSDKGEYKMYRGRFQSWNILILATIAILALAKPGSGASPPIGINLGWCATWGYELMFADAMKHAYTWSDAATHTNTNIGDANGWPTMDAYTTVWLTPAPPMNGTYALSFNGQATITPSSGTISGQTWNSTTNTTTATLVAINDYLALTFTNTKRTAASATNTGITNVKLMRPSTEGGSTPLATNVTFTPAYKTMLSKFGVLRFMDTTLTNNNYTVNWVDRTKPTFWSQGNVPVAWEYVVQLCNETGKDAWINVPRFASDDYITKLAQLFKYGSDGTNPYTSTQASPAWPPLNAGLHVYLEYSNENWNFTPGEITAFGNSEIFGYPVTTNGLGGSVTNGVLSSVNDHMNGVSGKPGAIPGIAKAENPNYFRDVVFNGTTSVMTTQTPAATATAASGGEELGMKFKSTTAGQITGLKFYKPAGETGTHTGRLWSYGLSGSQAGYLWNAGSIEQSMNFPATGTYTINFWASNVSGENPPTIQISVDGVNVGGIISPANGFQQYTSAGFTISSTGSHTVRFTNNYPTEWGRALLDLVTVSGPGTVTVANNSFESPNLSAGPVPHVTGSVGYSNYPYSANADAWVAGGGGAGNTLNGITGSWGDFGSYGKLLGTVTFSGESASGWQTATLGTAVSIAANTTYMVSVNSNSTYGYTNTFQNGPLTWDGAMNGAYNRKWVKRAVQMSNLFRSVYGDSAMPGTSSNPIVRPVLMMLASGGWIDNYTYNDLRYLQDYYNNQTALTAMPDGTVTTAHPPTYYFYGGGGAPYYAPWDPNVPSYDINTVWTVGDFDTAKFTADWLPKTADYYVPQWGRFISYEGGPQLPDGSALSMSIFNDTRMTTLMTSHQTAYNQYAGDLFVYYNTMNMPQWGFTSDMYNLTTPKMTAVNQINASTQAASVYGTPIPATLAASATVPASTAPNVTNMSASVTHTDYAGYVVYTASAAAFSISLSAGSSGASNQAEVYVDGALLGAITIPNTGGNTTYGTSATVTTPTLAIGTHGILVKAKTGSFGLNALFVTGGTVTIPNPPTGLAATGTYQQVGLSWTGSAGATSYNVYRGTTAGGESATAIATGVITTSYTNTGLTNGTTYFYKVKAVNSAGTSGYSSEASAAAVDNVAHFVNAATAPTIDGANTDACWTAATSYPITLVGGTITNGSDCSGSFKGAWDATNLYLLTDVTDDVKNNDSANVYDDDGIEIFIDGDNSKSTGYDTDDVQYLIGWNDTSATAGTNGASKMTGITLGQANPTATTYRIETKIPWASIGTTATGGKLTGIDIHIDDDDDGGARDGSLDWKDAANVAWGNPSVFGIARLDPAAGGVPPVPTGLTATAGNTQVALSWTASSGATAYDVKRSTVSGSGYATISSPTGTSYTNTGLTNGTTYYYVVAAKNASGSSANSAQVSATPVAAGANLALNKPATASSVEATGEEADKAVDGNSGTRWASLSADPQWIYVDLQATYNVTEVKLNWEAACGKDYLIQVSPDASTWTTIKTVTGNTTGGVKDYTGLTGSGRYVRVYGTARATGFGYSLFDFEVYGSAGGSPPAAPTGLTATAGNAQVALSWSASSGATAYDVKRSTVSGSGYATVSSPTSTSYTNTGLTNGTTYFFVVAAKNANGSSANSSQVSATPVANTTNRALNKPAFASSVEATGEEPGKAVDGNSGTRWTSLSADPQWIYVDLQATFSISRVKLNWETACGKDYLIQVSPDATNWTTIKTVTGNTTAGVKDYTGLTGSGRYVRVYGTARATGFGYSLFDLEVY